MGLIQNMVASLQTLLINFYQDSNQPSRFRQPLRRRCNFKGDYQFHKASIKNSEYLLIIVAGFKEYLWDDVFERISKFAPVNFDICVVSPGVYNERLSNISKGNAWSYLHTKQNKLSLAQNIAIREFPFAKYIFKMDEDIVIGENCFEGLIKLYDDVKAKSEYDLGFISPLLNVNGFSYRLLLTKLGLLEEYKQKFGDIKSACTQTSAWGNPDSAVYLWKVIEPFDKYAAQFACEPLGYKTCPHRFSIGFIFFERTLWEEMVGFTVAEEGILGVEEADICVYCTENSKHIIVSQNVLAGHFSFGPQTARMKEYLQAHKNMLKINTDY